MSAPYTQAPTTRTATACYPQAVGSFLGAVRIGNWHPCQLQPHSTMTIHPSQHLPARYADTNKGATALAVAAPTTRYRSPSPRALYTWTSACPGRSGTPGGTPPLSTWTPRRSYGYRSAVEEIANSAATLQHPKPGRPGGTLKGPANWPTNAPHTHQRRGDRTLLPIRSGTIATITRTRQKLRPLLRSEHTPTTTTQHVITKIKIELTHNHPLRHCSEPYSPPAFTHPAIPRFAL